MALKSYKARGIVLGTLKYGEKGLIVHMLTDTHGRQSYMVQGVKPSAKGSKMALLQPMFAVEFEGLQSSKMSMHRMNVGTEIGRFELCVSIALAGRGQSIVHSL